VSALELVVEGPDGGLQAHRFGEREPVWLGRDPGCELVLDSALVSRRHACVERVGAELCVRDQSVNGTDVDGAVLHHADLRVTGKCALGIGPYRVLVRALAAGAVHAALAVEIANANQADTHDPVPLAVRRQVQRRLLDHLDLARIDPRAMDPQRMRPEVERALAQICDALGASAPAPAQRGAWICELADEALGLGPLSALLADPEVSEIMVVDPSTIYVERRGVLEATALRFTDDEAVRAVIERIVTPLGRRIDESTPLVDARLPDGSRVNAIIPPLASRGPCITIRKFAARALELTDLVRAGSLGAEMAAFLVAAVRCRKNIVIAGGTGSGKTTLLNVLSAAIPERERIVTIEDAAELRLRQSHVVGLEARPANLEGKGAYTIRDLVRNALRMRPDRIVVGECRGGEAIDMLQAMNTGHEGSMTTTHANSPREAVARLETLCLMSGLDLPVSAIRRQLAGSLDLIVQQSRFADGARRVTSVSEVAGLDDHGEVQLREIYGFERGGGGDADAGAFRASGYLPSFAAELEAAFELALPAVLAAKPGGAP
jgi:pilus assembly protein CpaF